MNISAFRAIPALSTNNIALAEARNSENSFKTYTFGRNEFGMTGWLDDNDFFTLTTKNDDKQYISKRHFEISFDEEGAPHTLNNMGKNPVYVFRGLPYARTPVRSEQSAQLQAGDILLIHAYDDKFAALSFLNGGHTGKAIFISEEGYPKLLSFEAGNCNEIYDDRETLQTFQVRPKELIREAQDIVRSRPLTSQQLEDRGINKEQQELIAAALHKADPDIQKAIKARQSRTTRKAQEITDL